MVWLALCACAALLPLLRADLIFRVPEVLVRHAAAPKSVGTGPANASRAGPGEAGGGGASPAARAGAERLLEVRYEEYFVEHDVSTPDARRAAEALNLDDVPETRAGCGTCSASEAQYCEWRVLADHCCCERRYAEPLPWLPHTCYAGPRRCRPLAPDCARYARLRDCCCMRRLALKWKSILSNSSRMKGGWLSLFLLTILVYAAFL
ncbi:hypothetical protein ACJJTC_002141 [Scirpophaga incertulas]